MGFSEMAIVVERARRPFRSMTEQIDAISSGGKLNFHVFCVLAELERDLIFERNNAGLQASRARGWHKIAFLKQVHYLSNTPKKTPKAATPTVSQAT